jgi:hypothetical protein
MARSMKGILSGVEGHVTGQKGAPSLEEFAIVVYSGDMRNLVSGKELESSTLRKSPIGEYQTVKGVLMGTFSEGADGIRKKLER